MQGSGPKRRPGQRRNLGRGASQDLGCDAGRRAGRRARRGLSSVYNLINGAKHSIDVTMYEFSDTTAEHDLAAAAKRGVHVHVILDQREHSENSAAYSYFGKVFIGSENFSNTSLNDNRELGLIISSHAVMSAIAGTFASDFRNGQHWS
jgi:phosphatidylserine/phosphatidylglycerophosphate/cardiolipin synthase-like enzyme